MNMENGSKGGILGSFGRRYTDFEHMGLGHPKLEREIKTTFAFQNTSEVYDFLSVLTKINEIFKILVHPRNVT